MVYNIAAFVAKRPAAEHVARAMVGAKIYKLEHADFLVVPVTDDTFDAVVAARGESEPAGHEFWRLTQALAALAAECSVHGPIAYVETDYFAGEGVQGAAAWEAGKLIWPPAIADHGVINAALRLIGLHAASGRDEFDTLGLGRVRMLDAFENLTPVA